MFEGFLEVNSIKEKYCTLFSPRAYLKMNALVVSVCLGVSARSLIFLRNAGYKMVRVVVFVVRVGGRV